MGNDIYEISARIKNIIASKDVSLSPVGNVLVNYFTLMLKELYDFSVTLPVADERRMVEALRKQENVPLAIIQVSTPKGKNMSLYDGVKAAEAQFGSVQEALTYYTHMYRELTESYGMTGDEFWVEAESSSHTTEDYDLIMRLARSINMAKYLIEKEKKANNA